MLLWCASCTSYPKKYGFTAIDSTSVTVTNPYFSDSYKDYVYRAKIDAFGNSFSGIFIVKKLGKNHHRIAFTTELGNRIFDFSFKDGDFKINQILKEMDKKILINILKNDFRVLVNESAVVEKAFVRGGNTLYQTAIEGTNHFFSIEEDQLRKIIKTNNGKGQVEFLFSEINDDLANDIQINHQNLRLSIRLISI